MENVQKSLQTLKEMLADRGYDIEQFEKDLENHPVKDIIASSSPVRFDVDPDIVILYCMTAGAIKEARQVIQVHIEGLEEEEVDESPIQYLIIAHEKVSSNMASILEDYDKKLLSRGGSVTVFHVRELQFNPSRHQIVPKHEKMEDEDVKALLQLYQLKNRFQLPLILKSDVMARYLGLRHGDVVKIYRNNQCSGEYLYYRCCL